MKKTDTVEFALKTMRCPDRAGAGLPLDSDDGVKARNLRQRWPGKLEAVEQARTIGRLQRDIAMTDWREGSLWLFSVDAGILRCEGRITPDRRLEADSVVLGDVGAKPVAWAGVGEFFGPR